MVALASAALLVGYTLLFAAVQGGRFIRNPLLAITEPLVEPTTSSTPTA